MVCGNDFRAYLVGGFSAIGGFLFGYHLGVISGVLTMHDFKNRMNYTGIQLANGSEIDPTMLCTGFVIGIFLVGCFIGSLFGGQTSDRLSRKSSISIFSFLFTISAAIQTFPYCEKGIVQFLIGRFFAGIAVGALSMIVPVYHSEIAVTRIRGRTITFQQWAITIGIGISFWVNLLSSSFFYNSTCPKMEWQIPIGLQMVPSIILGIGILFCPFSPRWLISHDREDEAREVLMKIRSVSYDEIEEELNRIKNEVAYLRENEIDSYRQLFRTPLLRPLLLGIGIQVLQQLSGINTTIYYAPQIFANLSNLNDSTGTNSDNSTIDFRLIATGVYGTVNVLFTIPTMIYIDKLGRRFLLISGGIIMFISLLAVGIVDVICKKSSCSNGINEPGPWILTILIHIFVAAYAFSWGPIPWVYCTEIYPLTMRARATSLTTAANWITNLIMSMLGLVLLTNNYSASFFVFSSICSLMTVIVFLFYPETKDQHLENSTAMNNQRLFVPQTFEARRRNYNRTCEQSIVNQTDTPMSSEQNSVDEPIPRNSSRTLIQDDDDFPRKSFDTNEVVI